MRRGAAPDHHGYFARPSSLGQMELSSPSKSVARRVERSDEGVSALQWKVFVDVTTAFMEGRNMELADIAEKVLKSRRRER